MYFSRLDKKEYEMKVFIVKGEENSGKTQYIRSVFVWLLAKGFKFENKITDSDTVLNQIYARGFLDIFGICTYKNLKIAILSAGDNKKIADLISTVLPCDILICASSKTIVETTIRELTKVEPTIIEQNETTQKFPTLKYIRELIYKEGIDANNKFINNAP